MPTPKTGRPSNALDTRSNLDALFRSKSGLAKGKNPITQRVPGALASTGSTEYALSSQGAITDLFGNRIGIGWIPGSLIFGEIPYAQISMSEKFRAFSSGLGSHLTASYDSGSGKKPGDPAPKPSSPTAQTEPTAISATQGPEKTEPRNKVGAGIRPEVAEALKELKTLKNEDLLFEALTILNKLAVQKLTQEEAEALYAFVSGFDELFVERFRRKWQVIMSSFFRPIAKPYFFTRIESTLRKGDIDGAIPHVNGLLGLVERGEVTLTALEITILINVIRSSATDSVNNMTIQSAPVTYEKLIAMLPADSPEVKLERELITASWLAFGGKELERMHDAFLKRFGGTGIKPDQTERPDVDNIAAMNEQNDMKIRNDSLIALISLSPTKESKMIVANELISILEALPDKDPELERVARILIEMIIKANNDSSIMNRMKAYVAQYVLGDIENKLSEPLQVMFDREAAKTKPADDLLTRIIDGKLQMPETVVAYDALSKAKSAMEQPNLDENDVTMIMRQLNIARQKGDEAQRAEAEYATRSLGVALRNNITSTATEKDVRIYSAFVQNLLNGDPTVDIEITEIENLYQKFFKSKNQKPITELSWWFASVYAELRRRSEKPRPTSKLELIQPR